MNQPSELKGINIIHSKRITSVLLLWICIALVALSGCRKDQFNDCFQSTGDDVTEVREVGSFSKIVIGEKFDLILTQDSTQSEQVKITCGSKIIGQIVAKVKNNTLTIENKNTCNFVRSYDRKISIEIRVRFLEHIELFSASNLSCPDTLHFEKIRYLKLNSFGLGDIDLKLKTGWLDVRSVNSGNIKVQGFSNILTCSIEEVTQFDARDLLCDDIYFDCHSPLDCFVNPKLKLFVKIFNSGNVYYNTTPSGKLELVEHKGSGQMLKL